MNEKNQAKPAGCTTCWFGASVLWLFFVAHIADDVRHNSENLLIFFIVPFLAAAAILSVWAVRGFWHQFPNLVPRRSRSESSGLSIFVGLLLSLAIAALWGKSPLFIWVYDSCKIILLIVVSGLILGFVYNVGGRLSVMLTLLSGAFSAVSAFLAFLVMGLLFGGGKDLWLGVEAFASIGIPYAVSVALYDCYRKASTAS